MKVLQVLYSGLGGHASVVFSLVDGDLHRQWEHSLLFYGIEDLNKEYAQKAAVRNIRFDTIKAEGGKPWRSWKLFYRSLKIADADIILLHSNSLLMPAWWYCKRNGKKLLTVEHTPNQVKRRAEKWISILAHYFSTVVVLLTQSYFDELKKILGKHFHEKKTVVIPNGINTSYFVPGMKTKGEDKKEIEEKVKAEEEVKVEGEGEGQGERKKKVRIGMAARFSSQKDQALLVDVMEQLQKNPCVQYDLLLAGGGEELENVKRRTSAKGMDEQIHFAGNLDEAALLSFYQSLDIYVHASKGETMSTSILQAMACGLPIVASDIPGIHNLLTPATGILVEHRVESFGKTISQLAACSANQELMGRAARQYVISHFSNKRMFELYNQIIKKYA